MEDDNNTACKLVSAKDEILEAIRDSYDETIPRQEFNRYMKYLENYITNLEQRIKSIKGSCKALGQKSNNQKQEIKRLYKQRDKFNKKYRYVVAEKENLVQYACDLEDKICNLNAKIDEVISEIEKELFSVRKITFTKYKSNEWNNCLSFNDDILPILNKLDKLKEEKDEN